MIFTKGFLKEIKRMKQILKNFSGFYFPFILFTIIAGTNLLFNYQNGDWVLWFCTHFNSLVFQIFKYITLIGEPQVLIPCILIIFLLNMGSGAFIFISWFSASMTTIVLKGIINNHRPPHYFKDIFIECSGQTDFFYNHSTPSGHTTAAFAFFAALALLSKYKWAQFVFFIAALVIGLSRIILFVHFYYDVYFGAIIGAISAFIIYYLLEKKNLFNFNNWKNKSILKTQL